MILATLAAPVFTSCYDDTAILDRLDKVEQKLTDLETKLNTELAALKTLLEGQIAALQGEVDKLVTVSSCTENKDGSYEIVLSDGKSFVVYPEYEQDLTGLVTTTTVNGVVCWAVYEEGKAVVVTDADGKPVPVVSVVPEVRVDAETGVIELSFDEGKTWIEVGTDAYCVFSDAEVNYSDMYTDEQEAEDPDYYQEIPMSVTVALPDGSTFTVTIDGAANFMFCSNYGGMIKTQYISAGATTAIPVMASNISEWIKEVPAGWVVEEDTKYLAEYGQAEFKVTAPSAEAIASGAAVAEGNLKVLAVAEGGKSITATVKLTTKPFAGISAAKGVLNVQMNAGLGGGYLVGVSPVDAFDADAIIAELKPAVEAVEESWGDMMPSWSPWYVEDTETVLDDNYFDSTVEGYKISDLVLAEELVEGETYIVWAIAIDTYPMGGWYDGYRLGDIATTLYLNGGIELDETKTKVSFNDINITVNFKGVESFFGYFAEASYGTPTLQDIADQVNGEYLAYDEYHTVSWENGLYVGDPNSLVNGYYTIEPGSDYYLWLVPRIEGKKEYTVNDVYFYEWSTNPLVSGGSLAVTAGEPTLDYKKITVPLTAEGAVYTYYSFVDPEMVSTIADKQEYLLTKGTMRDGGNVSALIANIAPAQTKTLLAMAVDKDGKYGEVFQKDYTSKEMEYAAAVVKAELQGKPAQTGVVKISCDAEVDTYYYWYGSTEDYQWENSSYFGGSAESASAFIALTPDSYLLDKVTAAELPAEGIEMEDLTVGSPSVFVVSAKLTTGEFTKATVVEFTPEMDLGTIVYATDDNGAENPAWVAAKPTVTYEVDNVGDFAHVTWTVDVPEGFTAKTACVHPEYLTDYPSVKSKIEFFLTYPYIDLYDVVEGEEYSCPSASKGYNIYTVVCDAEGNYYEVYVTELDITGGFGV